MNSPVHSIVVYFVNRVMYDYRQSQKFLAFDPDSRVGENMAHAPGTTKVVSIRRICAPECAPPSAITQERLQAGVQLLVEQRRILEALQKFKMDIDNDLAAGGEIEAGELTFDRELKIVRPHRATTARALQVSIR
jgi:hypothetical protein